VATIAASRSTPATAAARQVEVPARRDPPPARDDPTLEPRDVIVMCPDIETFAPLIHATFGAAAHVTRTASRPGGAPRLRVRLADRASAPDEPVLGVVAALLELADAGSRRRRCSTSPATGPVRRRFGLDDEDLARLEEWVTESGVRWGLDAAHRERVQARRGRAGHVGAGLSRVLVGVTMTEDDRGWSTACLPLDDVDSGAIELAGRLAELVDRLATRSTPRRAQAGRRVGRGAIAPSGRPPDATTADATPGSAPSSTGILAGLDERRASATDLALPRSARCCTSACRAARPGPTSGTAT
jgi:exodeoxyribonuclease V gamma subunit